MKSVYLIWLAAMMCLPAAAQPVIKGVANAGSFAAAGLPNSGIAMGSMFIVFGTGLGPATLTPASSFPLPTNQGLAGTTVSIANSTSAIMIYTSATQVAAIVPSSLNITGDVNLTVTYNGQTSKTFLMNVTTSSFGEFTVNQSGMGPAVAYNYISESNQPLNGYATPATPGQLVTLWGTGLGPVSGSEAAGPLPGQLQLNLQVYVGGQQAQVPYYGRSGCCAGIDQVVFAVPQGVAGCTVPVVVAIAGIASNTGTIAVSSDGSACSDALGPSSSDVENAASKGSARFAYIGVDHSSGEFTSDTGTGAIASTPFTSFSSALSQVPSAGSCTVIAGNNNSSAPPSPQTGLDAGQYLTIDAPGGGEPIYEQNNGSYSGDLPQFQSGTYKVSGSGGSAVGAFNASLTVPASINSFGWSSNGVTPGSPLTVSIKGGDPAAYVIVSILSSNELTGLGAAVLCSAAPGTTSVTVPGYITGAVPPGQGSIVVLMDSVPVRFSASGLDQGFFSYAVSAPSNTFTIGTPVKE